MKAVVVKASSQSEDGLQVKDVPALDLPPLHIRIRVLACSIDATDVQARQGVPNFVNFPMTPGYQVVGMVDSVGEGVDGWTTGQVAAGVIPITSQHGGCAEEIVVPAVDFVAVPASLSIPTVAACIGPGVRAVTALHYQLHIVAGETLLVFNGVSPHGLAAIQMARRLGAVVLATVETPEETEFMETIRHCGTTIDSSRKSSGGGGTTSGSGPGSETLRIVDCSQQGLVASVMDHTAGLGVDCMIGLPLSGAVSSGADATNGDDEEGDVAFQRIQDAIHCIAPHGRWSCTLPGLQLDPPQAEVLHAKCASLCFLNEQTWVLAGTQHGRYRHVLTEVIARVADGTFSYQKYRSFPLERIRDAHRLVPSLKDEAVVIEPVPREQDDRD